MEIFTINESPDILCITEHWCNNNNINLMAINGYTLITHFTRQIRAHGGSMIYVKNKFNVVSNELKLANQISEEFHFECCAIKLEINNLTLIVVNIYHAPEPNGNHNLFLKKLHEILQLCRNITHLIYVCGDFNIN